MTLTIRQTIALAHKTMTVWFAYLVAASISLQEFGGSLNDYVPVKIRHWVMGCAALAVVIDKMRRSLATVKADAGP